MRRFMLVLAGAVAALTATAVPAAAATSAPAASCVPAEAATYRHSFDGARGIATIYAVQPLCRGQVQPFALVSYTAGGFAAAGQFVYDVDRASIGSARRSVTLHVDVPRCHAQVDAFAGASVRNETTSGDAPYGAATLGFAGSRSTGVRAWYAGGTTECAAAPAVTFDNACDGTLTATLANGAAATVQAVFLTGSRRIHVSPGHATTVKAAAGRTLTIRDSTFTTYAGRWRTPASACPTAAPTRVALPAPAATTSPATASAATPSATTRPRSTFTAEPPAPAFSIDPAALTAEPPAALPRTGMSLIAVGAGLLLIGLGVAALTYAIRNARHPS